MKTTFKTVLVVGDNHAEIIKKYSASAGSNNPHYQYERCPQEDYEAGYEDGFANPFTLLYEDIEEAFVAKKGDVNWERMHKYNTNTYKRAWEMVVEGSEPEDFEEERLKKAMENRIVYFTSNFANKEDYINHSTCFWCHGVATENGYVERAENDNSWITDFYDNVIAPLPDDTVLAIYEVRSL
ncbi:MAG: hypothetical protein LUD72_10145 [Bacteroidales bacterium]|nr:hypothetical protein [Bacteroidales bacterium]